MSDITGTIEQLEKEVGDVDALRKKYASERDRRLRPEGEAQYLSLAGEYEHFETDDPHAPELVPRDVLNDEFEVAVVGGGFSGMLTAARLREAGVEDIRIIEGASDFGGTWYWNRYPGAQCDVESYCYLPLLEETGYIPKEKYSSAPEIFEHAQRIAKFYDLYSCAVFQTRVDSLRWDGGLERWILRTDRGDAMKPRFVVTAPGPASRPKLADIPGLADFEGRAFHTGRWDYAYTGGDHTGGLHKLSDKKVAIIGTGASAIQVVPHLGASAERLYVFQRTPSSVDVRGNKPTDYDWAATLQPGWQRERRENFNNILLGVPVEVDLVHDAWTDILRDLPLPIPMGQEKQSGEPDVDPALVGLMGELADFKKMNQIRSRVESVVEDPDVAEKLKPWYSQWCKRPTFSDNYLPTFNRPNVSLVDTSGSKGVERITKHGVVTNGVEYQVDCIILATGFEIGTTPRRRFSFDIIGEDSLSLFDYWAEGLRTFHGYATRGFPNWFYVGLGQNGHALNMTSALDEQARHVAYVISEVKRRGAKVMQPTREAEQCWVSLIRNQPAAGREFLRNCTPGYFNNEGNPDQPGSAAAELYAGGANAFNALLEQWRDEGTLDGLELRK